MTPSEYRALRDRIRATYKPLLLGRNYPEVTHWNNAVRSIEKWVEENLMPGAEGEGQSTPSEGSVP